MIKTFEHFVQEMIHFEWILGIGAHHWMGTIPSPNPDRANNKALEKPLQIANKTPAELSIELPTKRQAELPSTNPPEALWSSNCGRPNNGSEDRHYRIMNWISVSGCFWSRAFERFRNAWNFSTLSAFTCVREFERSRSCSRRDLSMIQTLWISEPLIRTPSPQTSA